MAIKDGIYPASMSVLNTDLKLNSEQTLIHAEKLISLGAEGVVLGGSTGQSQSLSNECKMNLIDQASKSLQNQKIIIGPGTNSLLDTAKLINYAKKKNLKKFLIMPGAYGWSSIKNKEEAVYSYFAELLNRVNKCEIIIYNFSKLNQLDFTVEMVERLVKDYPNIFLGLKDSGNDNLFEKIKIKNFKIYVGSEKKLLSSLKCGCSGLISATVNTFFLLDLARKVFEDFKKGKDQEHNELLMKLRSIFDEFNLIEGLHTLYAQKDAIYKNILPPLKLLNEKDKIKLFSELEKLNINIAA